MCVANSPAKRMLSEAQLATFVRDGAVTINSGLSPAEVASASVGMFESAPRKAGTLRSGRTCDFFDKRLLHVIAHPWFEEAAKQALSADSVTFFQTAIINAWPDPEADPAADDLQAAEGEVAAADCTFSNDLSTRALLKPLAWSLHCTGGYHTDMQYARQCSQKTRSRSLPEAAVSALPAAPSDCATAPRSDTTSPTCTLRRVECRYPSSSGSVTSRFPART